MRPQNIAYEISTTMQARLNCLQSGNSVWLQRHEDFLDRIVQDWLPHGAGIDSGNKIDLESKHNRNPGRSFRIDSSFHLMDDNGYYVGWKNFSVVVRPTFSGIDLDIVGRIPDYLGDYLADTFHWALSQLVTIEFDRMLDIKTIKRVADSGVTNGAAQ